MADPAIPTDSMSLVCSSKANASGCVTCPMRSSFEIPLEFDGPVSYFVRASNRPVFPATIRLNGQNGRRLTERMRAMAVSTMQDDKKKALNLAIAQIEKSCGKGSIMRLGADQKVRVEAISTGAINLDAAIGVGGIPRGRITEIYGPESSGKTTL